jgi:hypothetical protein
MVKNALGILAKLTEKRTFQIRYKRIVFFRSSQGKHGKNFSKQ